MNSSETFARVLATHEESPCARAKTVSIEEWKKPCLQIVPDTHTLARPGSPIPDMLDSVFVDFHRELKEYMMDTYGLMGSSEAVDLHTVIARHVTIAPDPSGAHAA